MKVAVEWKKRRKVSSASWGSFVFQRARSMSCTHRSRAAWPTANGRMPHSQSRMAPLLDIVLRSAEPEDQKIAEALFGSRHIVLRIHGPEDVIVRHLLVERGHESLKSLGSNRGVNVLVFQ